MSLTEQEQFFYDNAGYSYMPARETEEEGRVRCARELARAEDCLKAGPYYIQITDDPEPWDGCEPYEGPLYIVSLYSVENDIQPALIGSLGSVACESEDDPYIRVVSAELALEHIEED